MSIKQMHHVGLVVDDLPAATAFFEALGLVREGAADMEGDLVERVIGLEGVRSSIVMLQTPDGRHRLELSAFATPAARDGDLAAPANTRGLRHIAFVVDDLDAALEAARAHGATLVGEVVRYEDVYRLCYVRGPDGVFVELAEELG
jgi:catechol 2,3-dioxygenase-like lactoylglutathione lyase family enzyme